MNEKFIKFLGLASTVALSCTLVNAADIPVKEIQPRGTVLPAVIMPAQDAKAEDKVLQPATDVKKEVKEEVKAVEEKVKETKKVNENRNQKMSVDSLNYTQRVIEEKFFLYDNFTQEDYDIIIFDRGINDEFIWLKTFGAESKEIEDYHQRLDYRYVDMLLILTCDIEISLKRKYLNSLSIMVNKWTNQETMQKYLDSLDEVFPYLEHHAKKIAQFDSSNVDKVDVALDLCNKIVENISNEEQ